MASGQRYEQGSPVWVNVAPTGEDGEWRTATIVDTERDGRYRVLQISSLGGPDEVIVGPEYLRPRHEGEEPPTATGPTPEPARRPGAPAEGAVGAASTATGQGAGTTTGGTVDRMDRDQGRGEMPSWDDNDDDEQGSMLRNPLVLALLVAAVASVLWLLWRKVGDDD